MNVSNAHSHYCADKVLGIYTGESKMINSQKVRIHDNSCESIGLMSIDSSKLLKGSSKKKKTQIGRCQVQTTF